MSSATVKPIQKDDSPNSMYSSRILFPQTIQVILDKIFFQFFLNENFWKPNVKAHTGPFRPSKDLYRAWLEHRTYINRKYSSWDRTMFDSILTVYVVIYIIVQGKSCSKRVTSMNDLTALLIVKNRYHDKTFSASTMKSDDIKHHGPFYVVVLC